MIEPDLKKPLIIVKTRSFYPLIVVKTKVESWIGRYFRFKLKTASCSITYIISAKKGDRYVLAQYLQHNLQEKPIIKFLSAYIYPSSDPIFIRTESF
jgi:hypothetical protein